jgi:phosphoserine aminotransferase
MNFTLNSDFSSSYPKFATFYIKVCQNDTIPGVVCKSEDEINDLIDRLEV